MQDTTKENKTLKGKVDLGGSRLPVRAPHIWHGKLTVPLLINSIDGHLGRSERLELWIACEVALAAGRLETRSTEETPLTDTLAFL